ncbi:MAG: hypothetical protein MZV65_54555 [Chromatiales bacterium]|nr:hypothetical protein [Chromatiales bacterium]
MPNVAFLTLARGRAARPGTDQRSASAPSAPSCERAGAGARRRAEAARRRLGRRAAGRRARARGRLPADPAGRQGAGRASC